MSAIISIVTICFENPEELIGTINSVEVALTGVLYEQIVVDGSTSMSCQDALKRCGFKGSVIHEEDEGVYDAMNKGAQLAIGEYVLFLNSGDFLYEKLGACELLDFIGALDVKSVVYGDVILDAGGALFLELSPDESSMNSGVTKRLPSHQSILYPREAFFCCQYDSQMMISADSKLTVDVLCDYPARRYDGVISVFKLGGRSNGRHSISDLFLHWDEWERARGIRLGFCAKMKSVMKYAAIAVIGWRWWYTVSLSFKSDRFRRIS